MYIALISVPVDGTKHNIAFKLTGFRSPVLGEGPIDIESIVEADQELVSKWNKARSADKKSEIEAEMVLPEFLSGYIESGQTSNAIFDILDDTAFAEVAIGETKLDLSNEISNRDAEIAELKAALAANEEKDAEIAELKAALAANEGESTEDAQESQTKTEGSSTEETKE